MTPHTLTPPRPTTDLLGDPRALHRPRYTDTDRHFTTAVSCACGWSGGEQSGHEAVNVYIDHVLAVVDHLQRALRGRP